uniref:Integrase core domain containing protein n=1 Tax=Solanum tuberosum TaxID=4113 RepID=M1E075_SOLTU
MLKLVLRGVQEEEKRRKVQGVRQDSGDLSRDFAKWRSCFHEELSKVVLLGGMLVHRIKSDRESAHFQPSFSKPEDDQPLQARQAEIRARVRQDPSKILEATPPPGDTVLAPAQTVVPAPPVQGPSPWLLKRLKL